MAGYDFPRICQKAVKTAAGLGADFDYSPESISALEGILTGQHELFKQQKLGDIYVWNLSVMFGVYLGQTLLRCGLEDLGYDWSEHRGVAVLTNGTEDLVNPIGKVGARIRLGQSENVRLFFELVLDAANGELPEYSEFSDGSAPTITS